VLGLALIYLIVLSPELGGRPLGVAAVALCAITALVVFGVQYRRSAERRRLLVGGGRDGVVSQATIADSPGAVDDFME
jgi:hypothetical protein